MMPFLVLMIVINLHDSVLILLQNLVRFIG